MNEDISRACIMRVTMEEHWSAVHMQALRVLWIVCQSCTKYDDDSLTNVTNRGFVKGQAIARDVTSCTGIACVLVASSCLSMTV